jgi:hypothetical protein
MPVSTREGAGMPPSAIPGGEVTADAVEQKPWRGFPASTSPNIGLPANWS